MPLPAPPSRPSRDINVRFASAPARWLSETARAQSVCAPAVVRAAVDVARGAAATIPDALGGRPQASPAPIRSVVGELAAWPTADGGTVEVHDYVQATSAPESWANLWGRFCVVRWPSEQAPPSAAPRFCWHRQLAAALAQAEAWALLPPNSAAPAAP